VDNLARLLFCLVVTILLLHLQVPEICTAADDGETGFEIAGFEVTGNSIFPANKLQETVAPFTGSGKTADDVEKSRDALERLYHDAGYPAVMVNIPEQTLKDGIVRLQVIESRIGQVNITGNRYFSMEKVMKDLPSLAPGAILYLPKVQEEAGRLNRNQDFKVDPIMSPGKELGTIDVELKVEDRLPLHGYLELNNRASHDTSELRLNGLLRYDNLWQKEHSIALQYQTAPQDTKEVEMLGGTYVLPAPWNKDRQLAFYGIWSDSNTAFGEGFNVTGKGEILGVRYALPLPQYHLYTHNMTLGLDYKHFNQAIGFKTGSGETTHTPVSYLPLSFSYSAFLPDAWGGMTQFNGGMNLSLRGIVSDEREFELKRYKGRANYLYATAGIQRTQKLPAGMGLSVKIDGQMSDQPLIDNEEYIAGGMESVRGYMESEAAGDDAMHGSIEISFPDPLERFGIVKWLQMSPYLFYDMAELAIIEPLPGQDRHIIIEGAGGGIRGSMTKHLEYELDWAIPLDASNRTERNDQRTYFKVKAFL
jgi:hemolysin activation/secretion protein